ncbi:hypothetical protein GCM10010401_03610 [Rarobacter faecitabidus]|uniref:Glycosyltransferase involved in cell wall biosynthesis n=1 Tax=Rarobacter faecitabidus TaxID=13243 RepID=A0A542ZU48_RARFA|nr:glycosyltransferase family 2 protein [Rarobacter faecitabidus]TQL63883.1 glycosyltransferase involved in cell wall biosynthesis [Rarobacter faecitabidus]
MSDPFIDFVIAAHDPRRRVDRAVASVLAADSTANVRLTLVLHNQPRSAFAGQIGQYADDSRLRIVEFHDESRSPAGPFNHGISLASGEYFGIMGSDDFLEPGALEAWASLARAHRPDYLMASLRDQDGAVWREPLLRPGRRRGLDPVRDRLNYRTAPLGLISTRFYRDRHLQLTPGFASGEDIEAGLAVINLGRVDSALGAPSYVVGKDAPERVTHAQRGYGEEIAPLARLREVEWLAALPPRRKTAIAVKLWRLSVVARVAVRRTESDWPQPDVAALQAFAQWLAEFAPDAVPCLARVEIQIVRGALSGKRSEILGSIENYLAAGRSQWLLAGAWWRSLGVDSRLRRILRLRLPA